jgi:mono/diheme cytochrome c family protein
MAGSDVEAGRYLVIMGGCNDCHTDGYMQSEGNIPEESWLAGSPVGWRGPWGTTYARNLRLLVQDLSEDAWVTTLRERKALPPMPWMNVNQMSATDARALHRYIRSLGPTGERLPTIVPPGQEPTTPFILLEPVAPESK